MKTDIRRNALAALLHFSSRTLWQAARAECLEKYDWKAEPEAVMASIYDLPHLDLPGYLTRTISGPKDEADRRQLIAGLQKLKIFGNTAIAEWFIGTCEECPTIADHMVSLECMRLMALDILIDADGANEARSTAPPHKPTHG